MWNGGEKMSVSVVYWSGTGNTQAMAEAVAEGIQAAGAEANVVEVADADAAALALENAFALGCPSMGAEQLEETEMEPFVESSGASGVGERRFCCSAPTDGETESG